MGLRLYAPATSGSSVLLESLQMVNISHPAAGGPRDRNTTHSLVDTAEGMRGGAMQVNVGHDDAHHLLLDIPMGLARR